MKKNNFKEMERELGQKGFTNSGKDDRQKKKKKKNRFALRWGTILYIVTPPSLSTLHVYSFRKCKLEPDCWNGRSK